LQTGLKAWQAWCSKASPSCASSLLLVVASPASKAAMLLSETARRASPLQAAVVAAAAEVAAAEGLQTDCQRSPWVAAAEEAVAVEEVEQINQTGP